MQFTPITCSQPPPPDPAAANTIIERAEFLTNLSHEIRTPLTAILGYAEILVEGVSAAEHREAARIVRRNGDQLLALLGDLLDLAQLDAGRLELHPKPCSPLQVIQDVIHVLRPRWDAKGLGFQCTLLGPVPELICTDATRLRQILTQLLANAAKFTEIGSLEVAVSTLGVGTPCPLLQIDVSDTGIGMSPETAARIFEPFFQHDSTLTRRLPGAGLGLAICQRLARLLGGKIQVASMEGLGSRFSLTLATGDLAGVRWLESAHAPCDGASGDDPLPRLSCRVLLAEDGPDNQRLLAHILRRAGAEVTIVENGKKAVEFAVATWPGWGRRDDDPKLPFDIVLMDMQMPVMDGYEATRRLRHMGYRGPIVALTAHAMSCDRDKCLQAGCDDYASKPIDKRSLVSLVARHANVRRAERTTEELS